MSRIKIKNFGPIKEGFKEILADGTINEWLDIKKVTVFIGNQGSGKSTVAKVISTMTWMEKALSRGDLKLENLLNKDLYKHFEYQRIEKYFRKDTVLEYDGEFTNIIIKSEVKKCSVTFKGKGQLSILPKIMYVPAERNFLTVVQDAYNVTNIPATLRTFGEELKKSMIALNGNLLTLPIGNYKIKYDKSKDKMFLVLDNLDLEISDASSGYQSLVPLFAVTKYLCEEMEKNIKEPVPLKLTINQSIRRQEEIDAINTYPLSAEYAKIDKIRTVDQKYFTRCLINIVEEPEQNLFPSSQKEMLFSLLGFNNMNEGNKLIMTTHSPYLINYLTHAVKAFNVLGKINTTNNQFELKEKLNQIVPLNAVLNPNDWVIYELDEHTGSIKKLGNYKGLPDDNNYLNELMGETNELFANLLEIEDKCQISF